MKNADFFNGVAAKAVAGLAAAAEGPMSRGEEYPKTDNYLTWLRRLATSWPRPSRRA